MYGISDLLHWGQPWWRSINLNATAASGWRVKRVVNTATRQPVPAGLGSGSPFPAYINTNRVVLLGFAWNIVTSGGFSLQWAENADAGVDNTIVTITGAGHGNMCPVLIAGSKGSFTAPATVVQPADLKCIKSGTPAAGSWLTCWGIEVDGSIGMSDSYTGSPLIL